MAERYCFLCDTAVEEDLCPRCGSRAWRPTEHPPPARTDQPVSELAGRTPPRPAPAPRLPPPRPVPAIVAEADLPGTDRETHGRPVASSPGRWVPIAAMVVGAITVFSIWTGPSDLEPETITIEPPSITAQTTITVPVAGNTQHLWEPPAGTWVGGFSFSPTRPDTLYGPSMAAGLLEISPATVVVDSLPDGRLVGLDSDAQKVVLIGTRESGTVREVAPLPWPRARPQVSPDGSRLALIDGSGVPYVWIIGSELLASPAKSASTPTEAIASFAWSPDSTLLALNVERGLLRGDHYVWDVVTNEIAGPSRPGRAIALSNTQIAVWGVGGLELRDLAGRVLRRWDDVSPSGFSDVPNLPEGAFDPQQRYLAVRGRVGPEDESQDGLMVLSTIGTTGELLTTDPAQGFAWSGDGHGLYWLNSHGLQAWSVDPERASATLVGRGSDQVYGHLRVYDPAISPVPHPGFITAALLEIQDGSLFRRTLEDRHIFEEDSTRSVIPAGIKGYYLAVADGADEQPVTLANPFDPSSRILIGTLSSVQLPEGARLTQAVALAPTNAGNLTPDEVAAIRWYLETDTGLILHGPEAGLFTTVAEGSSLSFLDGTAFHVTPDGSAIQTVPTDVGITTLLTSADLDADRILAVGVVRRTLFALAATADGSAQIWQVPADSELLATPLFPPAPAKTSWALIVHTFPGPATGGEILADPDTGPNGELLAARIDGPDGPTAVVIAAPLERESLCGANADLTCVLITKPGDPLGFSPDGNWLLVGGGRVQLPDGSSSGGEYLALSTVGRGSVALPDPAPDQVAWVKATSD